MNKKASTTEAKALENAEPTAPKHYRKPQYFVQQNEDGFEVTAEIPGSRKKDVSITAHDGLVTVIAERASYPETWEPSHRETGNYDFRLVLKMNAPIEVEQVSATVKDGLLKLLLPLAEEAKPRSIKVA